MDSNAIELTVTAQAIAETLGIGRSTLNKYSRSLEEAGYIFIKDERGNRAYTERDIIALRHAISLLNKGVMYDRAMADSAFKWTRTIDENSVAVGGTNSGVNAVTTTKKTDSDRYVAELKQELTSEIVNAINIATEPLREENAEMRSILKATLSRLDEMTAQNRQLTEIVTAQRALAAAGDDDRTRRERERDDKLTEVLREIREQRAETAQKKTWWKFGK